MHAYARSLVLLGSLLWLSSAHAADVPVSNSSQLAAAIAAAKPGDVIILEDGTYATGGLSCDANGTVAQPITVKARNPLAALIEFDALEGFRVAGDHWHFQHLSVRGVCAVDSDCEHAFHVNGAVGFVLRGSRVVDFNAQLKVNVGPANKLPNNGLVEGNELYDTRARNTDNPTTKLNIDSGDDWVVRQNFIHDFEKGAGDGISYGAFLKCGGQRGIMERNLVVCASGSGSTGTRLGLSLGGGGCGWQYCEPAFDATVPCIEHTDGIVRNNIIVNCSDVGVYVNKSPNSRVLYNTIIATAGVDFRFAETTGEARGNVLAGSIRNRDGATGMFSNNVTATAADFAAWYVDPMKGDLTKKGDLTPLLGKGPAVAEVTDDYCGRTRSMPYDVGALQHSLGDCNTSQPVSDGGLPIGPGPSDPPGTDESGCGCALAGRTVPALPIAFIALLALAVRRRREG